MPQPHELTLSQAAQRIREGRLSPVELMECLLARIDRLEPRLQAWVYLDHDAARADAEQKGKALLQGGEIGPLHGVPIGVKDIYYTAGIPTTACSKVYAGFVPDFDAASVALLKDAGAIILGKTVTTEFACLDPSPTLNPWSPTHTPGGSSSGSAVAVAAGMCPAALGSQTVGSVLRPASYNGVVGLKPTFGRVSRRGVIPVSWSLDTVGWMTRTVEDAALLLQVMAGPDPLDPAASRREPDDYLAVLDSPRPPRIGLLTGFFHDNADPETRQHVNNVADRLSKAGAAIEELPPPDGIEDSMRDQRTIMAVEAAAFHEPMYWRQSQDYQPLLREMLRRGLETDGVKYSRALESRTRFIAAAGSLAEKADVLLTPTTPTPALADLTNTGNPLFQGPWTYCGLPAITIPSGLAESGLPLGIQLVSARFQEPALLAATRWCESVLDVSLSPPLGD